MLDEEFDPDDVDLSRVEAESSFEADPLIEPASVPASEVANGERTESDGEEEEPRGPFVVAIGASAGGLEAIESFFDNIPSGTGAAYVVLQHLSPDFKSLMDQLLARHTTLTIKRAEEDMPVEPECIYLIPPRMEMRIRDYRLKLSDQAKDRVIPLPIDIFFRSLAEDAGARSVGIVLSGTGSDGSRGIEAIKAAGGVVMVQDITTAKFDGMPTSAINTGVADVITNPWEMGKTIVSYMERPFAPLPKKMHHITAEPMRDIFNAIRRETGIDFGSYKDRTIFRRLGRRMGILQIDDISEYRSLVLESRQELDHLVHDFLIGVTEFFRDPGAFARLESALPQVLELAGDEPLRVWVAGCSTGEEAYSIAIMIEEYRQRTNQPEDFKIFATDVNANSVARASEGFFSFGISASLSQDRLERFFERSSEGFRIRRAIRDRVVFAQHNIVKDPPFTRMHLVTCRNMLIYFRPETQQRAIEGLHFALRAKGVLFLGPSETPAELAAEFEELDASHKLFIKRRDVRLNMTTGLHAPSLRPTVRVPRLPSSARSYLEFDRICSAFLSEFVPTCLVLSEKADIIHSFGDSSKFLTIPTGRATLNVLQMVNTEVRTAISTAMHRSRRTEGAVSYDLVPLTEDESSPLRAQITVKFLPPQRDEDNAVFLLLVGEPSVSEVLSPEVLVASSESTGHIDRLNQELQHTKESLQATIEELETTNEELQSTNEELLASNEELQSTNEELHSVNEELYTVNAEHQKKIEELTVITSDMENLLRSTEIGTVFLDQSLQIRKFTPQAAQIAHLVDSDVGRPIGHLASRLKGMDLETLAERVLATEVSEERKAQDKDGTPRLVRFTPYRHGQVVEGVVITLLDISTVVAAETSLRESEERFQKLVENLDQAFWMSSPDGFEFHYVSPLFEELCGTSVEEMHEDATAWFRAIHPEDRENIRERFTSELSTGNYDVEYRVLGPIGERWIHAKAFPIRNAEGEVMRIAGFAQDISERHRHEAQLRDLAKELESKARTDALTGLSNRRGLESALSRELSRASRAGQSIAAILIDVDDFKQINDALGHSTGDVVLQGISNRMQAILRPTDLLARIGGDEFLIILPETRLAEAVQVAERLRLAVGDDPMSVGGEPLRVSASLGVSIVPLAVVSIEEVLDSTREALGSSKKQGKNRVVATTDGHGERCYAEATGTQIKALTKDGNIHSLSQTIRDVVSGEVMGYEMLSRGPEGPYHYPSDFFRLSHEKNVLTLVDLQCLRSCVRESLALDSPHRIHVNIFPSTLVDSPIERIIGLLDEAGGPERFCIELSEQQFLGAPTYLIEAVQELRKTGAQIAVDDVGFGRSSIEALVVLEPDVIKIAREFVMNADKDTNRRRGLERLTRSAQTLSTALVAEGVETEGERDVLIELGIHRAQGYLWDRPAAVESPAS